MLSGYEQTEAKAQSGMTGEGKINQAETVEGRQKATVSVRPCIIKIPLAAATRLSATTTTTTTATLALLDLATISLRKVTNFHPH